MQAVAPTLVVLGGPVGVGRSTGAQSAARLLRARGCAVACMDLDQLFCMIRQRDGFDDPATWRAARQAAAVMADHFLANVVSKVPETLRQLCAAYEDAQPDLQRATTSIATESCTAEQVARQIAHVVLQPGG